MLDRFDSLTGLYDEATFYNKLDTEIKRVIRYKGDLSVMIIEPIFETAEQRISFLYPALKILAEILKSNLRGIDIPCRLRGELAVIFPNTNPNSLGVVTSRLVSKYEKFISSTQAIETGGKAIKFYVYGFGKDFNSIKTFKEAFERGDNAVIYELNYEQGKNEESTEFQETPEGDLDTAVPRKEEGSEGKSEGSEDKQLMS